jgi:hypothetical protein
MLMTKALTALAASSLYAQSNVAEEIQQLDGSAVPDVDPGASKGPDKPIVAHETVQLDGSAAPNVSSRAEKRGSRFPSWRRRDSGTEPAFL